MSNPFNAGPRLAEAPRGDASRQAVDALRGYAFQLYASVLGWLTLGDGEDLYLEVAEDYAVVAAGAMEAVQAKDTAGSGAVTLRTGGVRRAIETLVDLTGRNPRRRVHLRYLSTSEIGEERATSDRIEGVAALRYWERVSQGRAEVAPLRARLLALGLNRAVADFLGARTDEQLLEDLVRRIAWDCGRGGVDSFKAEIEAVLATDGPHGPAVDIDELPQAMSVLVEAVLEKAISPLPRKLTAVDRTRVLRRATHTSLRTADLRRLLGSLSPMEPLPGGVAAAAAPDWLYPLSGVRDPSPLVPRQGLVDQAARAVGACGIGIVFGGAGFGKSLLARQTARVVGGDWLLVDLRNLPAGVVRERLSLLLARSGSVKGGLILDDFDEWDDAGVERGLAQLLSSVARRGAAIVATTHREPTRRVLATLGVDAGALIPAIHLTAEEVTALVAMAGGQGDTWGKVVQPREWRRPSPTRPGGGARPGSPRVAPRRARRPSDGAESRCASGEGGDARPPAGGGPAGGPQPPVSKQPRARSSPAPGGPGSRPRRTHRRPAWRGSRPPCGPLDRCRRPERIPRVALDR